MEGDIYMNVNTDMGQLYTGNDGNNIFSNVSIRAMSKEDFVDEMEKKSSKEDAAVSEISKEGKVKLLDVLGNGGKMHLEMTEEQKTEREIKEKAFQAIIQPATSHKVLSSKDLRSYDNFSQTIKINAPELSKKIDDLMGKIINRQPGENYGKEFIDLFSQANKVYANAQKGQGAPILDDYNIMIGATAADFRAERDQKSYYGITQRAEDITKAYATAYAQIVKGYEDGTRKAYAIDNDSKSGYRLMTMEEELAELDKAYEKSTEGIAAMLKQSDEMASALEKYVEQLAKAKRGVNADEVRQEHKKYSKEFETMPKDLGDKMKNVADLFKQNFQEKKTFSMDFVNNLMNTHYYIKK